MINVAGQICETSPAVDLVAALVRERGRAGAKRIVAEFLDNTPNVDAAALASDWSVWARPKQNPTGEFVTCLYLTGRGFGKTYGIGRWINEEVEAGRVRAVGLAAQDEANSVFLQVLGPSGLIATAPAWHRPSWEASSLQLVWPNGARAYVRTPEVPGKIRGYDYDLAWLSELQSWPTATRDEALSNFRLATRLGAMRMIYDATPKRRHPLLRALLAESERDPERYRVIRGSTHENAINLADGYVEELTKQYGGTLRGREELLGEMLEDSENSLVRQEWIDKARRVLPDTFKRRALGVDPAITSRKGSDQTGIVVAGLGSDDQAYVLGNYSGKYAPPAWAKIVLDRYAADECDVVLVETNRGGELVTQNLRAAASGRGLSIAELGKDEHPRRTPGVVNVKVVFSQGAKEDRAQPVATAYERGRVSHVRGVDLSSLEDTLTTWEPGARSSEGNKSPDDVDALTFVIVELLGFTDKRPDARAGFKGIGEAAKQLLRVPSPAAGPMGVSSLFRRPGPSRI